MSRKPHTVVTLTPVYLPGYGTVSRIEDGKNGIALSIDEDGVLVETQLGDLLLVPFPNTALVLFHDKPKGRK